MHCKRGLATRKVSVRLSNAWFVTKRKKRMPIFTALHVMQTRYSDENSVRLSVTRVIPDKTEERSVHIFTPYERTFSLALWEEEWLVGATPSTWNFGSTGPCWSEIADFQPIIARSSSAVTASEKSSINANRKSTTRFPMSFRQIVYVYRKPPKGALKRKVSKIWTTICDNVKTVRDCMSVT